MRRVGPVSFALVLALELAGASARAAPPPALAPPTPEVLAEARAIVEQMKRADKGPYARLRWYCEDGTVLPPQGTPCTDHGGGRQHAEPSPECQRLAALGWHVGTIFTALSFDELWDGERRNQRLRELPLEHYLLETDDGWVLRHARTYRGRIQIEDEEELGRKLLLELLAKPGAAAADFLLARESVRTIPHGVGGTDRTRTVRRISKEIADRDATFEPLRLRIHMSPDPASAAAVRAWAKEAAARKTSPEMLAAADHLARELDLLYGKEGRAQRLDAALARLKGKDPDRRLQKGLADVLRAGAAERTRRLSAALRLIREQVSSSPATDAATGLRLLDLSLDLESELLQAAADVAHSATASRASLFEAAAALLDGAYGVGLLSARERDALALPALALAARAEAPADEVLEAGRAIERAAGWGRGAVFHSFAEALVRYGALEPKAEHFPDDLLRSSPLLPLADVAATLARDAERLAGRSSDVFGKATAGLRGLNPGAAAGRLRLVRESDLDRDAPLAEDEIVVLPRTVSELGSVAGILTLSEGNVLSHVQMLARNLGIPNAVLPGDAAAALAPYAGKDVLFAVGTDGSVVLESLDGLAPALRTDLFPAAATSAADGATTKLVPPPPDLSVRRPLLLSEMDASLAGKVVGPKAANAGQLAKLFPGHVAAGIGIPFGIFAEHATQGSDAPKTRLDRAFARFRGGEIDDRALAAEVEAVRLAILKLRLSDATRAALAPMMQEVFGDPGTYGVFVRSDTNVEDLPGFTGAGLNETISNVVGFDAQLAGVIQVWASPFTARAMAWRTRALARPEEVYPSVFLMRSVPSEKSGVLVTADVATGGEGVTVATAWGVSGAVDGETAETLVLRPDGSVTLVAEAHAAYRRVLERAGGVGWATAESGRVLTDEEQAALRELAAQAREKLAPSLGPDGRPLPWDMEFGFVGGRLWLFQVRPLVERGRERADRVVRALAPALAPAAAARVPLGQPPGSPAMPAAAAPGATTATPAAAAPAPGAATPTPAAAAPGVALPAPTVPRAVAPTAATNAPTPPGAPPRTPTPAPRTTR